MTKTCVVITQIAISLILLGGINAYSYSASSGWCEVGAQTVVLSGFPATPLVQSSSPSCTVTVLVHSTGLVATIYSDGTGTPLGNPFTANTLGQWQFFAANGNYDVITNLSVGPVVTSNVAIFDLSASPAWTNGGNSFTNPSVLGTLTNADIAIQANGIELARFYANNGGPIGSRAFLVESPFGTTGLSSLGGDMTVSGFSAFGGTTLNNNSGTGFVGIKYDHTFTNTTNETRGVQSTVRNIKTTADALWDFFAVDGATTVEAGNTQTITGQMKGVVGELYLNSPNSGSYTVNTALNFQADMPTLGTNVTIGQWYWFIVSPPSVGGTITNGSAIDIENLDTGSGTVTNATAIAIKGINNFGRITWPGTNLTDIGGVLQVGSGLNVGSGGSQGVKAGSYAIGSAVIIDGSANVSTTGFGNFSYLQEANANAPGTPSGGFTRIYVKSDVTDPIGSKLLYYKDAGGNEYTICNTGNCGSGGGGITGNGSLTFLPKIATVSGAAIGTLSNSIMADNGAGAIVLTGTNHVDSAGGYYVNTVQVDSVLGHTYSNKVDLGNLGDVSSVGDIVTTGTGHHIGGSFYVLTNTSAPASPAAGFTNLYVKSDGTDPVGSKVVYYKDSGGNEYAICTGITCAVAGGITGSGTTTNIPKFTGSSTVGNSIMADNGSGAIVLTGTNHIDSAGGYYVNTTQIASVKGATYTGVIDLGNLGNVSSIGDIVTTGVGHHLGGYYINFVQAAAPSYVSGSNLYSKVDGNLYYNGGAGELEICNTTSCNGGGITGSGTTGFMPKFTGSTAIGNSSVQDNGSTVSTTENISASGFIQSSLTVTAGTYVNSVLGFKINSSAPLNHYLCGNGTYYVDSTSPCTSASGITGGGTTNTIPLYTGATTVGNSDITDTGGVVSFFGSQATISNAGHMGTISYSASTGYQIAGVATTGHYLRGNGSFYIDSPLLASDLSGSMSANNISGGALPSNVFGNGIATAQGIASGGFSINGSSTGLSGTINTTHASCTISFQGGLYVGNNGNC